MTLDWLIYSWDRFGIWVTNQPMFVEVALGIGLFYVGLNIVKALSKLPAIAFSELLALSGRIKKVRKRQAPTRMMKPVKSQASKPITIDDDAPPFVFR